MLLLMIKSVSFNDISEIHIINGNNLDLTNTEIKTKVNDGQCLENQYLYQIIYLYFSCEDEFYTLFNSKLMKENKYIFINLLKKIINHLQYYSTYHLYNMKYKINKNNKKDIDKLLDLLNMIDSL